MSNRKKGIFYYIRLDYQTFQGKLTRYFMLVALLMGTILLVFSRIYHTQYQEQKYITEALSPSLQKTQAIRQLLALDALSQPEARQNLNQHLHALNQLADSWQEEQLLLYQQQLLDQSEDVRALAETGRDWRESKDFTLLNKTLHRLEQALQSSYTSLQQQHEQLAGSLNAYLWAGFLLYFSCGVLISHLVIKVIVKKIKQLRYTIQNLAAGILPETIPQTSDEFYSTRKELEILSDNLKSLTHFAKEVGQGNFNTAIEAFDQQGALGHSLSEMRDSLKRVSDEQVSRRWFNEGISQFADILRKNNEDIDALASELISPLVKYLGAVQGALFVQEEDESGQAYLTMRACYAYDRLKYIDRKIPAGNGLIGQAYLEREQIYLKEIPADYESITTGMGQGKAKSLILMPLLENNTIEGVLEIASLHDLQPHQIEFLEKIAENIAATIATVKNNEKNQLLLQQAQQTAEQMGAQEEEMRQNMEEMQATQEEMLRAQKELANKETNLNAFINNTSDSIVTITREYKVGLINDTLKARYKGTPYEGIKEGNDILPTLGAVADEWKAYYERAFAGEHLDFTIKSSVQGEDSWRQYLINPIRTAAGEVVGASCLSRDITDKVQKEQQNAKKNAVLQAILRHPADAYLALDEQHKILAISPGMHHLFTLKEGQLKEDGSFFEQLSQTAGKWWKEALSKAHAGQTFTSSFNTANTAPQLTFSPVLDKDNKLLAVLVFSNKLS